MKNKVLSFCIIFLAGLVASCVSSQRIQVNSFSAENNCNQQNVYDYTSASLPVPFHMLSYDSLLNQRFSGNSLYIAHAIGITELLKEFIKVEENFKNNPGIENRLELMDLRQHIENHINMSSLEISAVASELDCEEERADQIADFLKKKETDRESKLTTAAIVTGAATAITTGVVYHSEENLSAEHTIEMAGGVSEAILGLLILTYHPKVYFFHERNHLREIWDGNETSPLFPPSIWYYFNYYNEQGNAGPASLRVQILSNWKTLGEWNNKKSKNKRELFDLYFGNGGKYTSEELETRSRMLDQLEAYVTLMKQDLTRLAEELENGKRLNSK